MMHWCLNVIHESIETVGVRCIIPCRFRRCANCLMVDGDNMGRAVHTAREMGWRVRGIWAVCPDCLAQEGRVGDSLRAFWRASDGLPPEIDFARNPYSCSHMTDRLYCTVYDTSMRCCHDACYSCEHFDGEREERRMALAVSTYDEDELQASIKINDDNSLCVYIHDAEGEQSVCMTMDQAVAMALWILKQNWEVPGWMSARIRVLPPRRNGDEGTRAER